MRIAHLTSAHPRYDTRIFLKQCKSLAAAGHEVVLVVADGRGEEALDGVRIVDAGRSGGRLERMLTATRRVVKRARESDADVYHLHDPELLPAALALARQGKRVVFDAHEDAPRQILSKPYLHPAVRRSVSAALGAFETFACRRLDAVVTATEAIRQRFVGIGIPATVISNYPLLGELDAQVSWEGKRREVCYVGGITEIRGVREVIAAMEQARSGALLNLVGSFSEAAVKSDIEQQAGWSKVVAHGFLSRTEVRDVLARSVAGLVTFLPEPNHIESQPNKMFEYMSAGVPVIASHFPLWREIVEGNDCGICVDPCDPAAIAAAVDRLVENPDLAERMGDNGRRAVLQRYNWALEEKKLLEMYADLYGDSRLERA